MQSATQWTNSTVASCPGTPQLQAAGWLFVLLPSPSLEASGRKVADPVLGNINLFKSPFTQFLSALLQVPLGPRPPAPPPTPCSASPSLLLKHSSNSLFLMMVVVEGRREEEGGIESDVTGRGAARQHLSGERLGRGRKISEKPYNIKVIRLLQNIIYRKKW